MNSEKESKKDGFPDDKVPIGNEEHKVDLEKDTVDYPDQKEGPLEILRVGRMRIKFLRDRLKDPNIDQDEKDRIKKEIEEVKEETKKAMIEHDKEGK